MKNAVKALKRRVDRITEIGQECKYYSDFISMQSELREEQVSRRESVDNGSLLEEPIGLSSNGKANRNTR